MINKNYDLKDLLDEELARSGALATGDGNIVREFYKYAYDTSRTGSTTTQFITQDRFNNFFHMAPNNATFIFFGLTKLFGDTMVRLLTSSGFVATVKIGDVEDVGLTKTLNNILEDNMFKGKLWESATFIDTTRGTQLFSVSRDDQVSDYPIIEIVEPENIELKVVKGRTVSYTIIENAIYKDTNNSDKNYQMHLIYEYQSTTDKDKIKSRIPVVKYEFFDVSNKELKPLTGNELKDAIKVFNAEKLVDSKNVNKINEMLKQIKRLPVVLKTNNIHRSPFNKLGFGVGDTYGLETIEAGLSETLSGMLHEIRKGKAKLAINDKYLPKDPVTGESKKPNDFETDYVALGTDMDQDGTDIVQYIQAKLNSEKFIETVKNLTAFGAMHMSLSPQTVGVTGLESINASQESQVEKEKVSLRTRETKHHGWRERFKELFEIALLMHLENTSGLDDRQKDLQVEIEFGDYDELTSKELLEILGKEKELALTTIERAVKQYLEKTGETITEEQLSDLVLTIKVENGFKLDLTKKKELDYYNKVTKLQVNDNDPQNQDDIPNDNEDEV